MLYTVEEIRGKLTPIFEEKGVIRAILFGSYAKGEATPESDIDIVAFVDEDMDILDFAGISGDVEETLNKRIDFLYGADIIPGGRIDITLQNEGILLYVKS